MLSERWKDNSKIIAMALVGFTAGMAMAWFTGCATNLPEEAKPKTPIQHFIATTHDFTLLADSTTGVIEVVTARAATGSVDAFKLLPLIEVIAGLIQEGGVIIAGVHDKVVACTGVAPENLQVSPQAPGLETCVGLTGDVIVATGDLRGLIVKIKPRLDTAQGGI